MGKKKKADNVISRTLVVRCSFSANEKAIIDLMTKTSKNVFNCTIFCYEVYTTYKRDIYWHLNKFLLDNKKVKITKEIFEAKLYEIYAEYYDKHVKLNKIIKLNNAYIYKYIIDRITNNNIVLDNSNLSVFKGLMTRELSKNNNITIIAGYKCETLVNIIHNICDSIYTRNYNSVKDKLLNRIPIVGFTTEFIENVQNQKYIVIKKSNKNYKNLVQKKLKFEVCSDQNYISRFTYNHLYENKEILPSDIIINIMAKAFESIKSFYALRSNGIKCNRCKYLKGDEVFNLFYFKQFIGIEHDRIRLIVGKYIADRYIEITKDDSLFCINPDANPLSKIYAKKDQCKLITGKVTKKDNYVLGNKFIPKDNPSIFKACYMYVNRPKKLRMTNTSINAIEIVPVYNGYEYEIHYKYDITVDSPVDLPKGDKVSDYISVDLGISNLMTIYNPSGKQYIINGGYLVKINKRYNYLIDRLKSDAKIKNKKECTNQIRRLLLRRSNKINHYFNLIVKWLERNFKTKKIVIGYNVNWKKGVNLGAQTNRKFYNIPYMKLIHKIKDKYKLYGSEVTLNEESYTSKCDALAFEDINKKANNNYLGKRVKRGLFKSSTGKYINADLNGAINILRKYLKRARVEMTHILGDSIYNPIRVDLFKYVRDVSAKEPVVNINCPKD